jgi:hypothetical protein
MKPYKRLFESETYKVYHGSKYDFDEFDLGMAGKTSDPGDYGLGIYFDTNIDTAKAYATMSGKTGTETLYTCTVYTDKYFYINFKEYNRFKQSRESNLELDKYKKVLIDSGCDDSILGLDSYLSISRKIKPINITKYMLKAGYDSIMIDYGSSREFVAFKSEIIQIIKKERL